MSLYILILFTTAVVINGQSNCSTYNPCDRNGYCHDIDNGEWSCECKFWWSGTTCSELTNSGVQVIVLGCLLGLLVILFYGLQIFHKIRLKKKQPKEVKEKKIVYETTLIDLAFKNARRSARLQSCVVGALTMILAAIGLVAKWSLIQPIHNEIVNKYETNQSLYYVENSFCDTTDYDYFNLITFPISCFLILLFIITTKRTSLFRDKLWGYGAPPMPVDFISHIDRTFAAVIFAICADELLNIIQQVLDGNSKGGDGVIVVYLLRLLQVIVMGFRYYPFLAAVYMNTIFSLSCATLYAWFDFSMTIVNQGMCQVDFYPTYDDYLDNSSDIDTMFDYYGTGPNLVVVQLCTDIPRYLCLAYINIKIPMLLFKRLYRRFNRRNLSPEQRLLLQLTREQKAFFHTIRPDSVEMLYVQNLFRSADHRPRSHTLWGRLIPKKIYEWRDDFRFSTRIICIYSSMLLLLYYVIIQACIQVLPYLQPLEDTIQTAVDALSVVFIPDPEDDGQNNGDPTSSLNFPIPKLVRPYLFAVFITLIVIVLQLLVLLANMRRNLLQLFRGEDCEIPRRQRSRYVSYASGNIHFAGYFIGYLIWGFILIAAFSVVICVAIDAFITFGSVRFVEKILQKVIPSVLFVLFKQYLNKILAQYVFLQHRGEVLALNNRRILMIFIFFNFFLDAFLGFISSIVRLIKSVIGGIIYMCRLDYSPLGRKLETMDGGFSSYCGFLHTECTHRHPVMLVFVSLLYTQTKIKELAMYDRNYIDNFKGHVFELKKQSSSRYVRKWKLAVFLIRNPTIVFFRKAFLSQLNIEDLHALNDLDNDDKKNLQRRLSIYTRRMSAARASISSETNINIIEKQRF
ncbi:unnamed protein product [Adineta steineri]|uniref:EGF-like domain-containing protein n=1 Tax=Adineta steineri TaxID=433720 RepID=A0A819LCP1_9BILA|nr:unnamed protein product [Adineta steineri]CAF3963939.1 unnamed protein product [Adineta steineri]